MNLTTLFEDKTIKAKQKVALIGDWLLTKELPIDELFAFADVQKATNKASCIEAVEYATKKDSSVINEDAWQFVTTALKDNEPRIKWESAKVIGNTAALFKTKLDEPIANLLLNTKNDGSVVRWATAYALAEILKL